MSLASSFGRILDAIENEGRKLADLVGSSSRPEAIAVGTWTVADVANHLVTACVMYEGFVTNNYKGAADMSEIASAYEELQSGSPRRTVGQAGGLIRSGLDRYVHLAREAGAGGQITWHSGLRLTVAELSTILLAEIVVHGYDIATGQGRKWEVDPQHAAWMFEGLLPVAPSYVDPTAAAGFSGAFEVKLRGTGPTTVFAFDDGVLSIEEPNSRPIDCRISAEPASFLLLSYGRIGRWGPLLTGKVVAWGRKPWLGLKLTSLLRNP